MKTEVEVLTPELAQQYLKTSRNPKNRRISAKVVNNYACAMRAGKWILNGESIIFDTDGIIQQGHHRLEAVVVAGVPITTNVVRGVDPQSFTTYDCGKSRKTGDIFFMSGINNANNAAAMCLAYWSYLKATQKRPNLSWNPYVNPTREELLEVYRFNPKMADESVRVGMKCRLIVSPSVVSWLPFCVGIQRGPNAFSKALDFLNSVENMAYAGPGDPAYTLNKFFMKNRGLTANRTSAKYNTSQLRNATTIAWNAYNRGDDLQVIRVGSSSTVVTVETSTPTK